jgi:uncharacterized protein
VSSSSAIATVVGLFVYPIKACGAVALSSAVLHEHGLEADRRYMLVDQDGTFISQRSHPELARVRCGLMEEEIWAAVPERPPLHLPRRFSGSQRREVTIWEDVVAARVHTEGSAWFSALLQESVELVYVGDDELRQVNPERARSGDRVAFADGYPLLLTSESSLAELNRHTTEPVPMDRFRPNVVVSGWPAYAEDTLTQLSIGDVPLVMPKLCDRCVVTTTDQFTGERFNEPLRALAKTRRWDQKVWFGANLIPRGTGTLALGQLVTPHEAAST